MNVIILAIRRKFQSQFTRSNYLYSWK